MLEGGDDEGTKLGRGLIAGLLVLAAALAALTCWLFGINPLPNMGRFSRDPGWFLTFVLVYFFVAYFAVEAIRKRRK